MPPSAERTPRQKIIDVANGYFETLQLTNGTLHTQFRPDCDGREDGMQSTNNAQAGLNAANSGLGCVAQFELGWYRYDRLRDRRFVVVDEKRGIVELRMVSSLRLLAVLMRTQWSGRLQS